MSGTIEEVRAALAVGYLRGESDEGIRTWAESHGYVIVGSVDASEDSDPPSRLLQVCNWSGARTVLVRDLSTLGDDLQSSYEVLRELYESGISVVFVDRGIRLDGRTALGRLLIGFLSMAVDVVSSQSRAQQAPRRTGRPPMPVDESELMEMRDRGMSVRAIAKALGMSKSTVWRKLRELSSRRGKPN
ncbi:MAG: helix-turn-helix domain-containing protein [Conexivisphaera sp.]